MTPIWPAKFMRLITERDNARLERDLAHLEVAERAGERDRARDLAARLEQEHNALATWSTLLARDLERMHDEGAVDLDDWPTAKALVAHVNGWDPLSCQ